MGPSPDVPVNVHSRSVPENLPSADGCQATGLAPPSWFLTTSAASSVHGSRHVAAGTGSGFARFRADRSSKPKLLGPGPSSPLALPPCEGLLLVGSRAASLRPAPLLPFVACDDLAVVLGLPSDPVRGRGAGSSGSVRRCRSRRFQRCRQPPGVVLPVRLSAMGFLSGAPSVPPSMGCPTCGSGVRLDRVVSPVARLWLSRPLLTSR